MTSEGRIKLVVKEILRNHGAYWHMPVQNGMGAPTLDFICCKEVTITQEMVGQKLGLYLAVETKAPGKKPTPRQEITISEIERSGGKVFVIDGDYSELEEWLKGV